MASRRPTARSVHRGPEVGRGVQRGPEAGGGPETYPGREVHRGPEVGGEAGGGPGVGARPGAEVGPGLEAGRRREYGDITTSRTLARITDDLVKIPGTQFGVGLDGLIGLVPGIGDLVGTGLSSAIMVDAVRQRVPLHILARMGFNMLIDTGLGFVPVVGDAADVAHRANRKNYRLLEKAVAEGKHVDADVRTYVTRAVLMVIAFVVAALVLVGVLIFGILKLIGAI